jgi:hypothetical protein
MYVCMYVYIYLHQAQQIKIAYVIYPLDINQKEKTENRPNRRSSRESPSDEDMTNTHMTKAQAKIEFKAQSTLKSDLFASPVRTAGAGITKTDAQATYGLRFGHSIYCWKAKEISFPTQLIPYQNTYGVDRNRRNNMTTRICLDAAMPVFGPEGLVLPRVARPPPPLDSTRLMPPLPPPRTPSPSMPRA